MKSLKLKLVLLLFCLVQFVHAQNKEYYLEIPNPTNIPTVVINNGKMELVFSNAVLTNLFKNYSIDDFKLGFPGAVTPILTVVYIIKCDSKLIDEIALNYASYFGNHEQIFPLQELYIPNDLGGNPSTTFDQSYLNFVGAIDAWDISKGNNVIIGIGENVNVMQEDLVGKCVNVYGTNPTPTAGSHGTEVSVVAAGNTDNNIGIASIGFNATIKSGASWPALIPIANAGARVINLSWGTCNNMPLESQYGQAIIDELWVRGVIVVAAAGNGSPTGNCSISDSAYHYPAALNRVFAVTGIGHRSPANSTTDGNRMDIFQNFNRPPGQENGTYNDRVDLAAPGYDVLASTNPIANGYHYTGGTSVSAPLVTGAIGLMFGINPCLYPDEIESILKLTAVKIDLLPLNLPFTGGLGAGRLNAFAAVDMARDMAVPNGTVEVHDRIIDRWDFNLRTSPYEIKMSNNIVSNDATINFTARNNIEILSGDYMPANALNGFIDLKIQAVNTLCNTPTIIAPRYSSSGNVYNNSSKLYPNPNHGNFSLIIDNQHTKEITITIVDLLGKSVYVTTIVDSPVEIRIPNLPSGLYFAKLTSSNYTETIKFIKN